MKLTPPVSKQNLLRPLPWIRPPSREASRSQAGFDSSCESPGGGVVSSSDTVLPAEKEPPESIPTSRDIFEDEEADDESIGDLLPLVDRCVTPVTTGRVVSRSRTVPREAKLGEDRDGCSPYFHSAVTSKSLTPDSLLLPPARAESCQGPGLRKVQSSLHQFNASLVPGRTSATGDSPQEYVPGDGALRATIPLPHRTNWMSWPVASQPRSGVVTPETGSTGRRQLSFYQGAVLSPAPTGSRVCYRTAIADADWISTTDTMGKRRTTSLSISSPAEHAVAVRARVALQDWHEDEDDDDLGSPLELLATSQDAQILCQAVKANSQRSSSWFGIRWLEKPGGGQPGSASAPEEQDNVSAAGEAPLPKESARRAGPWLSYWRSRKTAGPQENGAKSQEETEERDASCEAGTKEAARRTSVRQLMGSRRSTNQSADFIDLDSAKTTPRGSSSEDSGPEGAEGALLLSHRFAEAADAKPNQEAKGNSVQADQQMNENAEEAEKEKPAGPAVTEGSAGNDGARWSFTVDPLEGKDDEAGGIQGSEAPRSNSHVPLTRRNSSPSGGSSRAASGLSHGSSKSNQTHEYFREAGSLEEKFKGPMDAERFDYQAPDAEMTDGPVSHRTRRSAPFRLLLRRTSREPSASREARTASLEDPLEDSLVPPTPSGSSKKVKRSIWSTAAAARAFYLRRRSPRRANGPSPSLSPQENSHQHQRWFSVGANSQQLLTDGGTVSDGETLTHGFSIDSSVATQHCQLAEARSQTAVVDQGAEEVRLPPRLRMVKRQEQDFSKEVDLRSRTVNEPDFFLRKKDSRTDSVSKKTRLSERPRSVRLVAVEKSIGLESGASLDAPKGPPPSPDQKLKAIDGNERSANSGWSWWRRGPTSRSPGAQICH